MTLRSFTKLLLAVFLFVGLAHVVIQVPAGVARIESRVVRK